MTDYRWTRLSTADATSWAALVNHLADVDGTEEYLAAEDLREELESTSLDPAEDTWAVWDGEQVVAFGLAHCSSNLSHEGQVRTFVEGGVHADHRGRGLGTELMDRLEIRARDRAAAMHPEQPGYLSAGGQTEGSSARALLFERGYTVARYFNALTRELREAPEPPAVEGVTLRSPVPADETPVHSSHDVAFRDHWGSAPTSEESWRERWTSRSNRHDVSTLAVDDRSGEVLAYVLCGQWVDRELYVNLVGTVPAARGRGLAAACLARTIALAIETGSYDLIDLDVDSSSPTGATRLYERLGFRLKRTTAAMRRDLQGFPES
ncbi:GNAT family N-acetyltransferase [Citricoccus sp. I39-566]|uniref:GNAT family N-acetyltransferase n=1 Tax=Citricoccus sp. I39-566 TaxID=3073268 RepID=UPI00286B38FE|nr:GNAT family N-acetyltransferase [Citricoccus sp. I39-566]WMY79700.1 GNAT family N-acetyltransferase [Citricoccus sp. I39-566]